MIQRLGIDKAWVWFAAQKQEVARNAADLASALRTWEYQSEVDVNVNAIKESIASVVTSEFQDAISTTEGLLRSIGDYGKDANLRAVDSILVA